MTARNVAARPMPSMPRLVKMAVLGLAAGVVAAANLYLAGRSVGLIHGGAPAVDWDQYVEAGRRVFGGDLYAVTDTYGYHYSPVLAYAFGPLSWLGTAAWRLLHVAAALALPSWPMRIVALASWPLWYDVETGNIVVFVVVAAAWAIRGSTLATAAYLALVILVPRPLMIPVAAWLLWTRPASRLPFAAAFGLHALAVLASGWGPEWVGALIAAGGDVAIPSNVGPSRFIGTLPWLIVGVPLAAWLTLRGRPGVAALAASPYWLPYYLLFPILELGRSGDRGRGDPGGAP